MVDVNGLAEGHGKRPHVTYLLSDLGGGTGHHLISLLKSRAAEAWTADIVSEVENTARTQPPVPVHVLSTAGLFGKSPFLQVRRWHHLRQRFKEAETEILHVYFFWSIVYGRLLRATGVVRRLVENREDLGFNWSAADYAFLRATRRIPDRVICVSNAVREVVRQREGVSAERLLVVHNGVSPLRKDDADSGGRLRQELGIPLDAPIVGMVANFHRPIKGAIYFVDALIEVAKKVPEVHFLLIGMGRNASELQQRADAAGRGSNLMLTGFREDIDRFYSLMDVSGLTSLSEGLSITLLESMRHGVPVVATDVGGNREIVRHGETGYLVPAKDVAAFAAHVIVLLQNPRLRQSFGERARKVIATDFNLSGVAAEYLRVYQDLNSEPRRHNYQSSELS